MALAEGMGARRPSGRIEVVSAPDERGRSSGHVARRRVGRRSQRARGAVARVCSGASVSRAGQPDRAGSAKRILRIHVDTGAAARVRAGDGVVADAEPRTGACACARFGSRGEGVEKPERCRALERLAWPRSSGSHRLDLTGLPPVAPRSSPRSAPSTYRANFPAPVAPRWCYRWCYLWCYRRSRTSVINGHQMAQSEARQVSKT